MENSFVEKPEIGSSSNGFYYMVYRSRTNE